MAHKTDFVRIGREGETVDGRHVSGQDLVDMATTYNRNLYGARIWLEHFRGFIPGGVFDALGDVLELKVTEESGKKTLSAVLEALPRLVEWNKLGQKLFTSMEIFTNPETGKAYLGGLAVTDSPASLGTEALQLYSTLKRTSPENRYTTAMEFTMDPVIDPLTPNPATTNLNTSGQADPATPAPVIKPAEDSPSLFSRISGMFSKKERTDDQRFSDIEKSIEFIAEKLSTDPATPAAPVVADTDQESEAFTALKKANDELQEKFTALEEQLEATPAGNFARKPAAGGDGNVLTTC